MDENPINPGEDKPEAEPIVAPDEVKETVDEPTGEPEPAEESEPTAEPEPAPEAEAAEPEPEPVAEPKPEPTPVPESMADIPTQPVMEPAPKKKSHGGIIALVIIAIALVAAGVVICLILLNNTGDKAAQNKPETPTEKPVEKPEENKKTSIVSCTASGDTWDYASTIEVNNEELKSTKITNSLKLSDDYDAEKLTDDEMTFLAGVALVLSAYDFIEDEGITIATEGDFETGAGFSSSIEIDRTKVKNEEVLKMFENVDGMSAEEIMKESQGTSDTGVSPTCAVK